MPPLPIPAVPESYRARVRSYAPDADEWLGLLPDLTSRYLDEWQLTVDGAEFRHGYVAVVLAVRLADRTPAALKMSYPAPESATERAALSRWDGRGAVRMLRSATEHQVLLLERLDADRSLADVRVAQAIHEWGELMRELSVPAPVGDHAFDTLTELARRWTHELPDRWRRLGKPCPSWLIEQAVSVCRLPPGPQVLVHTDLHYENVLAHGDGWRAIDPKPMLAVPEFAVAPMLWNRLAELDGHGAGGLRARCDALADSAGLSRDLSRRWSVAREVENYLDYLGDGAHGDAARSLWVARALCGREDYAVDPAELSAP
ncbi:aminoglycoside phosphotransferase family protein [Rhodococcus spelaei]|uniref:aminoglycoside phosphotransferase family protein n=1 Tax=Rhodococcus spelaei TaxID=2546320 RepID=UPI0015EF98C7|nr:aminoglycoside phosphotransferase family protein [Rhodococcus spelaei]